MYITENTQKVESLYKVYQRFFVYYDATQNLKR